MVLVSDDQNCDACGACCRFIFMCVSNPNLGDLERYRGFIKVSEDTVAIPNVCIHFNKKTNGCNIYPNRCDGCKTFKAGSKFCLLSRKAMGLKDLSLKQDL